MRKSWRQKFENGRTPEVEVLTKPFGGLSIGAKMLISTPSEVGMELQKIPCGEVIEVAEFRKLLASKHQADGACPLSTSIFLRIAAEVALEEMSVGRTQSEVFPFWRAIPEGSPIAKKLSCGIQSLVQLQQNEQHHI